MKHVVSLSTLYPNPAQPRRGAYVARSLEALARRHRRAISQSGSGDDEWRVTVINPIGIPPVALGQYRDLAQLPETSEEGGITVHRPRYTLIPKVGARRDPRALAKITQPLIEQIHAEVPVDLIDAQLFFPDGPAAAWIAQQMNLPLSIKARGGDIAHWSGVDFAREQMLEAARRADGMLAGSEALKRQMAALGMDEARIAVHYTGLDRDRFRPLDHTRLRAQLGSVLQFDIPDTAPLLVCVATLSERRGQDIAIAAMARIDGARLVLAGEGDDEQHLRELAADLGLAERVHFAGVLDHDVLPLVLSAADAMVLPTASEGLANAWIEAIACGTPVVTTNTPGAREIITGDAVGRLVERSPESVAAGVNSLLNDPPLRREVAAAAQGYSWERNADELAAHYDRILARPQ